MQSLFFYLLVDKKEAGFYIDLFYVKLIRFGQYSTFTQEADALSRQRVSQWTT